ncbi:Acyltransferase family protein [Hordeum vulgare]|nr:Acyltransferase family protein [Hordeum vulgare]
MSKNQRFFSALHGTRPPILSKVTATHPSMVEKLAAGGTLVLDVDTGLLLPSSSFPFPYFMLVALEAGGYLRGLVLLLLYPIILCMGGDSDPAVRLMAMVAFCGLRPSQFLAGCAVLPKWLIEDVAAEGFETMRMSGAAGGRRVCVTRKLPRMCTWRHVWRELRGRHCPGTSTPRPWCSTTGRLAFRPTAGSTVAMFMWLPLGVPLGAFRLAVMLAMPYRYSTMIVAATGMSWRLKQAGERPTKWLGGDGERGHRRRRGNLYVCNHRTLIDPVYVSIALDQPVRAVSYSLSRLSDLLSPIGSSVRLARDRVADGRTMSGLLDRGDHVVVCPEGTTCREPYLLRFSPLFAEISDDISFPVGVAVDTAMFYATTAGGLKFLDPLYYLMNPRMCYTVHFWSR